MQDGERQVAPVVSGIRRDHVARYEWAAKVIDKLVHDGRKVIDIACGIGYGSNVLARSRFNVTAIDIDAEALEYGRKHYAHDRITFLQGDASNPEGGLESDNRISTQRWHAATVFETVEHIEDPRPLLKWLRGRVKVLLASVPNEEVFPHQGRVKFHFRHYTPGEFAALLKECGWMVNAWYGQAGPESEVEKGRMGRTIIAVAVPAPVEEITREQPKGEPKDVTAEFKAAALPAKVPDAVAILGLGPSVAEFLDFSKRLGSTKRLCDEVWAINALGGVLKCDRIFHMDDIRIQEARAKADPGSNIAAMVEWIKEHPGPIYTSRPHPSYPGMVAFPLEDVLNHFQHDYFNSTAAYAVAYAVYIGVKKILLFGVDFTYPNSHKAEKGRACVEFWLGQASARGIKISLPKTTSLMDAIHDRSERLYGYDTVDVQLVPVGPGKITAKFTERDQVPTAEEIESRYDHSRHPSPLMQEEEPADA